MTTFTNPELAILTRHRAVSFLVAGDRAGSDHVAQEARYFLYSHAIELALKAYLLAHGLDETKCKKLGHDLEAAVKLAVSHQLVLTQKTRDCIDMLSGTHNRPFSFRYFNKVGWAAPMLTDVAEHCRKLLEIVQVPIFVANHLPLTADHLALRL